MRLRARGVRRVGRSAASLRTLSRCSRAVTSSGAETVAAGAEVERSATAWRWTACEGGSETAGVPEPASSAAAPMAGNVVATVATPEPSPWVALPSQVKRRWGAAAASADHATEREPE